MEIQNLLNSKSAQGLTDVEVIWDADSVRGQQVGSRNGIILMRAATVYNTEGGKLVVPEDVGPVAVVVDARAVVIFRKGAEPVGE